MSKPRIALVIPTIRENSFNAFVERWSELGLFRHVTLIVMEDNPTKTFQVGTNDQESLGWIHLCWGDIEEDLGDKSWIIPRRSDTVRSYAYYYAWKAGFDYILTLDDDCYPPTEADGVIYESGEAFVQEHLKNLTERTRWFNTLNSVKPRGIPFYETGTLDSVIVNHGLWTNVLDYDAPYQLANPIPEKFSFDNRIVPSGLYFPMCGMNVMWKASATVLMYHLLMGQVNGHCDISGPLSKDGLIKLPFDRFGDIWCGIFMKKIADLTRHSVSTGMPYIRHERASNPFTNLKKEANGIEVNEKLWCHVDGFNVGPDKAESFDFHELYDFLGTRISEFDLYPEHTEYFKRLGEAMSVWASLFTETK